MLLNLMTLIPVCRVSFILKFNTLPNLDLSIVTISLQIVQNQFLSGFLTVLARRAASSVYIPSCLCELFLFRSPLLPQYITLSLNVFLRKVPSRFLSHSLFTLKAGFDTFKVNIYSSTHSDPPILLQDQHNHKFLSPLTSSSSIVHISYQHNLTASSETRMSFSTLSDREVWENWTYNAILIHMSSLEPSSYKQPFSQIWSQGADDLGLSGHACVVNGDSERLRTFVVWVSSSTLQEIDHKDTTSYAHNVCTGNVLQGLQVHRSDRLRSRVFGKLLCHVS